MKTNRNHLALVTKKFNEFFLVDLKNQENFGNIDRFLKESDFCKFKVIAS